MGVLVWVQYGKKGRRERVHGWANRIAKTNLKNSIQFNSISKRVSKKRANNSTVTQFRSNKELFEIRNHETTRYKNRSKWWCVFPF